VPPANALAVTAAVDAVFASSIEHRALPLTLTGEIQRFVDPRLLQIAQIARFDA
jgi:hypothetical protein